MLSLRRSSETYQSPHTLIRDFMCWKRLLLRKRFEKNMESFHDFYHYGRGGSRLPLGLFFSIFVVENHLKLVPDCPTVYQLRPELHTEVMSHKLKSSFMT